MFFFAYLFSCAENSQKNSHFLYNFAADLPRKRRGKPTDVILHKS